MVSKLCSLIKCHTLNSKTSACDANNINRVGLGLSCGRSI